MVNINYQSKWVDILIHLGSLQFIALYESNLTVIKYLCQNVIEVNRKVENGWTPLHFGIISLSIEKNTYYIN